MQICKKVKPEGLEECRAETESRKLNMASRLSQVMRGKGGSKRGRKRYDQERRAKERGPRETERKREKRTRSSNGRIIWEREAGERESHELEKFWIGMGEKSQDDSKDSAKDDS